MKTPLTQGVSHVTAKGSPLKTSVFFIKFIEGGGVKLFIKNYFANFVLFWRPFCNMGGFNGRL